MVLYTLRLAWHSRPRRPEAITLPIGMSDVVILLGPRRARDGAVRRVLTDGRPVPTSGPRRGFGE